MISHSVSYRLQNFSVEHYKQHAANKQLHSKSLDHEAGKSYPYPQYLFALRISRSSSSSPSTFHCNSRFPLIHLFTSLSFPDLDLG